METPVPNEWFELNKLTTFEWEMGPGAFREPLLYLSISTVYLGYKYTNRQYFASMRWYCQPMVPSDGKVWLSINWDSARAVDAFKTSVLWIQHSVSFFQVQSLRSSFFNLLNKSAMLLTSDQLEEVIPIAWELLLEADSELTSGAG